MYVYGELQLAQLEYQTVDPTGYTGRVYWNATTPAAKIYDGTNWRQFLINDDKIIIGSNVTAANNVRLHRGAAAYLQLVIASDTTADGTLATTPSLAQWDARLANTTSGAFAAGSAGRIAWQTDTGVVAVDNGAAWKSLVDTNTIQTLTNKTIAAASNTISGLSGSNFANATAATFFSGPVSGAAAAATFRVIAPSDLPATKNFLINSGFDFWQRGTTGTVTSNANPATPVYLYEADRWYVKNILGGGTVQGIITYSQVAGVTNGSKYGAKVQITTAPTGSNIQNGCELYQTLENRDSLLLYGQTASFSVLVKSFGNVNQIGVQFYYKTTEAKVDTAIGAEVLTTVNTATFVACTISGQALGTSQTTSGVIGVRIRITAVSSGNTYDLNNGFVCEQAVLNIGSAAASWSLAGSTITGELLQCLRYYEKSYELTVAPGTGTTLPNRLFFYNQSSGSLSTTCINVAYRVPKRTASPTVTLYSSNSGLTGKAYDGTAAADITAGVQDSGGNGFGISLTSLTTAHLATVHYASDADI